MPFREGDIVKILDYHGVIGVVDCVEDDDCNPVSVDVIIMTGYNKGCQFCFSGGEIDLTTTTDTDILLFSNLARNRCMLKQQLQCQHQHIEQFDVVEDGGALYTAMKCVGCGLRSCDLDHDVRFPVEAVWDKRLL